jgi:uncharacterized Zn-finger protein
VTGIGWPAPMSRLKEKKNGHLPIKGRGALLLLLVQSFSCDMEVVHKCKSCSASYSSASNLRRHVKAAHRGIKYPCPKCDKVFSRTDNRSQHLKKEHPETVVKDSDGPAITKLKSVVVVPDGQEQPAAKRYHLEMMSATPSAHQ